MAVGTTGPEEQPAHAAEEGVSRGRRHQVGTEAVRKGEAITPSKGPGPVPLLAIPRASQMTTHRMAAGEVVQRGEDLKIVELGQSSTVPRELSYNAGLLFWYGLYAVRFVCVRIQHCLALSALVASLSYRSQVNTWNSSWRVSLT